MSESELTFYHQGKIQPVTLLSLNDPELLVPVVHSLLPVVLQEPDNIRLAARVRGSLGRHLIFEDHETRQLTVSEVMEWAAHGRNRIKGIGVKGKKLLKRMSILIIDNLPQ